MAAPAYVDSTSGEGTGTTVTVTKPVGIENDFIQVDIGIGNTAAITVTPPAGWKRCPRGGGHSGFGTTLTRKASYYKFITVTDPGTYDFTLSGAPTDGFVWAATVYRDVHRNEPYDAASVQNTGSGTNNVTVAGTAVQTVDDDTMLHKVAVMNGASDITAGTGWATATLAEEYNRAATHLGIAVGYLAGGVAGSKASELYVAGGTPAWASQVWALKSASSNPETDGPSVAQSTSWTAGASTPTSFDCIMPGRLAIVFDGENLDTINLTTCEITGGDGTEFTKVDTPQTGTDAFQLVFAYRVLDESDCWGSAPTFTTTPSAAGTPQRIGAIITNAHPTVAPDYATTVTTADTTTPDAGGEVDTGRQDQLVVLCLGQLAGAAYSAGPTGYTLDRQANNGVGGRLYFLKSDALKDAAENPGTYSGLTANQFVGIAVAIAPRDAFAPQTLTGIPGQGRNAQGYYYS